MTQQSKATMFESSKNNRTKFNDGFERSNHKKQNGSKHRAKTIDKREFWLNHSNGYGYED